MKTQTKKSRPIRQKGRDKDAEVGKKRASIPRVGFDEVVNQFVLEINSLESTLPLAMTAIIEAHKGVFDELERLVSQLKRKTGRGKRKTIDLELAHELIKMKQKLERVTAAATLVPRSFLVALVSQYDNFLGRLIQVVLLFRTDILNGSDKSLTFSELVGFKSIEAATEHIIETEVESVLRESHAKQFDWLERKFNVKLREGLLIWPSFVEITERRNLYVHAGGKVSAQYLSVCSSHGFKHQSTKKGDFLSVDPDYFSSAYAAVFEVGVKLAHVLWRKLMPEQREFADTNLLRLTYELLALGRYELAKAILDFATTVLKDHSSDDIRLRFVVNRAQAYKWSGDNGRAMEILNDEDLSALRDVFKLSFAVLREDYKHALELVHQVGKNGDIGLDDYREWPLFRQLRKQRGFHDAIEEVFGEPLIKIEVGEAGARVPSDLAVATS